MNISNNKLKKIQGLSKRRLKKTKYNVVVSGKKSKSKFFIVDEAHFYVDLNPYIKQSVTGSII